MYIPLTGIQRPEPAHIIEQRNLSFYYTSEEEMMPLQGKHSRRPSTPRRLSANKDIKHTSGLVRRDVTASRSLTTSFPCV